MVHCTIGHQPSHTSMSHKDPHYY
ncbi:hypothetical protein LINPERPRIM_LOCUS3058 [Linum perenne]